MFEVYFICFFKYNSVELFGCLMSEKSWGRVGTKNEKKNI